MRPSFQIGDVTVKPGERQTVDLPIARMYTHTTLNMSAHVIHGKTDGPVLFVSAAMHGDEILGVEIIRRLLKQKSLNRLKGTLLAVPIVNAFGFLNQSRYSPDRRDLNRFFPGNAGGSLTSRMAHLFMTEIASRCTHGIDLHTGSNHRTNLPQLRVYLDDPEIERLAQAFGAPVILNANILDGSLRQAVNDHGVQVLLYEAGEVLRFDETAIRIGVGGVLGVMRELGMLPPSRRKRKHAEVPAIISHSSTWVRAPISGIVSTRVRLGDIVKEKDVLAMVGDPFGEMEAAVPASASGIVIGRLNLPLVHKGDALFHIARITETKTASSVVEVFQQEFEPEW